MAPTEDFAGAEGGINGVGPGQVFTGMPTELFSSERGRKPAADAMPARDNGVAGPEDIASARAFLVSDPNARMTGQVVFVDGGFDSLSRGDDIYGDSGIRG